MSYKLTKPFTDDEYSNFIIEYNHRNGKKIVETNTAIYALELNEIINESGLPVANPNYETELSQNMCQIRISEIKTQLDELDKKRIRAVCEPSNGIGGQSWLEYYNKQAQNLRAELQELEGAANDSNSKK